MESRPWEGGSVFRSAADAFLSVLGVSPGMTPGLVLVPANCAGVLAAARGTPAWASSNDNPWDQEGASGMTLPAPETPGSCLNGQSPRVSAAHPWIYLFSKVYTPSSRGLSGQALEVQAEVSACRCGRPAQVPRGGGGEERGQALGRLPTLSRPARALIPT